MGPAYFCSLGDDCAKLMEEDLFMKLSRVALALAYASSPPEPDNAKQIFESAIQALNSGDYPAAEAGFNKVLEA